MNKKKILLITPPFVQINTPYPATAYIKGFLKENNIHSSQVDLSLEVILSIFSKKGLTKLFQEVERKNIKPSKLLRNILYNKDRYINTIDYVIRFLQNKSTTLAYAIAQENYLPVFSRKPDFQEMEWAFGEITIYDKAKYIATIYIEDLTFLIREGVDKNFGLSRYAEKLARCASSFDEIYNSLDSPISFTDTFLLPLLEEKDKEHNPDIIIITIPFPGNLYSALRIAKWYKRNKPQIKIIMGGGFVNTELRSIKDKRFFEFCDYLLLDDAEDSLLPLIRYINKEIEDKDLVKCFKLNNQTFEVEYFHNALFEHVKQDEIGIPDYSDLNNDKYISVIEQLNPMYRLWSDGRWNKIMLCHGCYWAKCSFCDCSLDYIKRYSHADVKTIVDRIESIISQTGEVGFHFVDEALPPRLIGDVIDELNRREIKIIWWGNIRFEKNFTQELCSKMKASGCIGVSGGIEVASDRILKLINKGISVQQVVEVTNNFSQSSILVHAYLMYGFPSQTAQEVIDSLEIVRQLFDNGLIQSGFWHRFALTAHSNVGLNPKNYNITITEKDFEGFAINDLEYEDSSKLDYSIFSNGLKVSLYNYINGVGFDVALKEWFDNKVPSAKVSPNYVMDILNRKENL